MLSDKTAISSTVGGEVPDVLILCGGTGSRLRSEVSDRQKCVADVDGLPFLVRLVEYVAAFGFKRFIFCTGYKAESVISTIANDLPHDIELLSSYEETPLGTGGAVLNASELVATDSFLLLNGDSFCPVDLEAFTNFYRLNHAELSIVLSQLDDACDYGLVSLDGDLRIVSFVEKSRSLETAGAIALVNAGIYMFSKNLLKFFPSKQSFSLEKDVIPALLDREVFGYITDTPFRDIGTPERLNDARKFFQKREQSR